MTQTLQSQEKKEIQTNEEIERTRSNKIYMPQVDIATNEDEVVILADMPGVDEKNVDITLEKKVLTIKGFAEAAQPDNAKLIYSEYGLGDYERSFTISDEINQDKIEASIKNGVLSVYLPKAEVAKTRKFTVKAG